MGITYGDHLIDSGHYDITPEQERERDEAENKKRVLASWARIESEDPPIKWLLRELRDLADQWAGDPSQPLNSGGPNDHICALAADLIEAAHDFRERMDHAENVLEEQDRSGNGLANRLRERARHAREENNATALGDALHFEGAATEIDRLQSAKRAALSVADERSKENAQFRFVLTAIRDRLWRDGESYDERIGDLKSLARTALGGDAH